MVRVTRGTIVVAFVTLLVLAGAAPAEEKEKTRNPFGVNDVADPDGKDVREFAEKVKLPGDDKDANAVQWVKEKTSGKKGSLDGHWLDRWSTGGGDWNHGKEGTRIKVVGDRVYILVHAANGKFLIDAKRKKNRLVGRYQGVDNPNDTGPIVLKVVGDERIDGEWAGQGRWDFRRKLK
jgi:hypothetical protein